MENKVVINKLRDNAELAMAAYGYFHLANERYDFNKDSTDKERLEYFRDIKKDELKRLHPGITDQELQNTYPTPSDILNLEHKYFKDNNGKPQDSWYHNRLFDGDFSPLQAQRFFSRYDLLIHQPNTDSGFSATLFGEKRKQKNTESKEISYTSEYGYTNYILALRGTEMNSFKDLFVADASLTIGSIPRQQYDDMINFYETCASNYPQIKEKDSLTLTGHSLGGALAQLFVLCFTAAESASIIKALYTYNVSLESRSVA